MGFGRTINISSDLKGMTVLSADTGGRLGEASDAILNPVNGKVLGIIVKTHENESRALGSNEFHVGKDAVMATRGASLRAVDYAGDLSDGVPASKIIGAKVVSEDGRLIGKIREAHISTETGEVLYRVTESTVQRFTGGGFYLPGDVPTALSPDGERMIVPSDTEDRHASRTLEELLDRPVGASPDAGRNR